MHTAHTSVLAENVNDLVEHITRSKYDIEQCYRCKKWGSFSERFRSLIVSARGMGSGRIVCFDCVVNHLHHLLDDRKYSEYDKCLVNCARLHIRMNIAIDTDLYNMPGYRNTVNYLKERDN